MLICIIFERSSFFIYPFHHYHNFCRL
ncbi:protein of unknown function [Rhodovastum atsumiense]|nr:protein of unknown function [Rhodovastum atsumiense]